MNRTTALLNPQPLFNPPNLVSQETPMEQSKLPLTKALKPLFPLVSCVSLNQLQKPLQMVLPLMDIQFFYLPQILLWLTPEKIATALPVFIHLIPITQLATSRTLKIPVLFVSSIMMLPSTPSTILLTFIANAKNASNHPYQNHTPDVLLCPFPRTQQDVPRFSLSLNQTMRMMMKLRLSFPEKERRTLLFLNISKETTNMVSLANLLANLIMLSNMVALLLHRHMLLQLAGSANPKVLMILIILSALQLHPGPSDKLSSNIFNNGERDVDRALKFPCLR